MTDCLLFAVCLSAAIWCALTGAVLHDPQILKYAAALFLFAMFDGVRRWA